MLRTVELIIKKSLNGHKILMQMQHQGFYLQEYENEQGLDSLVKANWYARQLKIALERNDLEVFVSTEEI